MSERPIMSNTLLLLNFGGIVFQKPNLWSNARKIIILVTFLATIIDLIVWIVINRNQFDLEAIYMAIAMLNVTLKMVMMICLSKTTFKAIIKMQEFWPIDKYGPHQEKVNKRIFRIAKYCLWSYFGYLCTTVLLYFWPPLFGSKEQLPYGSYLFDTTGSFEFTYFLEAIPNFLVLPGYCGFDFVYIAVITNIICEFKSLKIGFSQIAISSSSETDEHTMEALKELIDHHNVVLECCKYLNDIFYIPFLCLFSTSSFTIVFSLMCLILNGNSTNIAAIIFDIPILLFYAFQLWMYCYPGTILISESTEISFAVYQSNWWIKPQPGLRKAYVMIIQRANRPVVLSAGGIMDVNLQTFTDIMNTAYSFFTFVNAMYRVD